MILERREYLLGIEKVLLNREDGWKVKLFKFYYINV